MSAGGQPVDGWAERRTVSVAQAVAVRQRDHTASPTTSPQLREHRMQAVFSVFMLSCLSV